MHVISFTTGGVTQRLAVAGTGGVDQVLHDGGVHHGQGRDDKAKGDTGDGAEGNLQAAHDGVHNRLENGDEDNDRDGIEVLHQIVGDTVTVHLSGLGDEVTGELAINDPVDGVESEHAAGNQGTLKLVDEVVVPGQGDLSTRTVLGLPAGLGGIHVAVLEHDPESLEGVGDDRALGRTHDVELATEQEHRGTGSEHAQAKQVSGPEANVLLHVGSGQQRQRTQVDTAVEDHVDTLDGQRRVDHNPLAGLGDGLKSHLLALVLIGDQRGDVTLDTTGTQTNDQNGHDEAGQTRTVLQRDRQGRQDQNQETDDVDSTEDNDGLVLAKVLIRNDGTNDGGN